MWYVCSKNKSLSLFALAVAVFAPNAGAELVNTQNLTLSEPCIGCETTFSVSQVDGPAGSGGGTAAYTYSGLFEWTLDNTVSGRLSGFQNTTRYGLFFDNTHMFQSFLSPRFFTIVSSHTTTCPATTTDYNYISVRFRTPSDLRQPMNATSSTFFSGGKVTYDHTEEALESLDSFSLSSSTSRSISAWYEGLNGDGPAGPIGSTATDCSSGKHLLRSYWTDSPWDSYAMIFYGSQGFITVGLGGNPMVTIGSSITNLDTTRMNQLANTVLSGFFNAYVGSPLRTDTIQKNVYIYPNANGTSFEMREVNAIDDPWNYTVYGTLSCPSQNWNSPLTGFVRCTLTLQNVSGSGNAVCMVSKRGPRDLLACNAQYPSNNQVPVSIIALTHDRAKLAVTLSSELVTLSSPSSTTVTATLKNVTGVPISSMGEPTNVALRLQSPYQLINPFLGTNGTCLNTLGPYQTCTVQIGINPATVGTYVETVRVEYDTGESTQNGTATIITTVGLSTLTVTPNTTFYDGDSQQMTATARYSDNSTQDVTNAVTWSSSNNSLISITSGGLASFLGTSAGTTTITASLAGVNGTLSPTVNANPVPTAVLAASDVRNASGSSYTFTVTYSDNGAVNVSTIGNGDVRVTGPNSFNQTATLVGVDVGVNGTPRVATYSITPPGGSWDPADDGTYTVSMEASQVADTRGAFVASGSLGTFVATPIILLGPNNFNSVGNSANGLNSPSYAHITSGGKLILSDYTNNRLLIWNSVPTANHTAPDVVVGQQNLTSLNANRGGSPAANTLSSPLGVWVASSKLIVADSANNRVLIYNSVPTTNGASADVVIGQANMTSNSANAGGTTAANTLSTPRTVWVDAGGRLYVADGCNHRVLIYNSVPTSNQASADLVLGQANMTSSAGGASASATKFADGCSSGGGPGAIHGDSTNLFVTDPQFSRVLVWTSLPNANNAAATRVLGQTTITAGAVNAGFGEGTAQNYSLYFPSGVWTTGSAIYVADERNHRVLRWNSLPASNGAAANVALGQADLVSESSNRGSGAAANTVSWPYGLASDGTMLLLADRANHRVLRWNALPTTNGANADIVIGQPNMTNRSNNALAPSSTTMSSPYVFSDGTRLFVSDAGFNRVLIWNSLPSSSNTPADIVLGQPDMNSSSANNGGISASTMSSPFAVHYDGTKLFVADRLNNRVLIWNSLPTQNGQAANVILGQANGTSSGFGTTATTFYEPWGVYSDGTRMAVADRRNNRVMYYSSIPTTNGASATFVWGQRSFTCGQQNKSNTATCFQTAVTAGSLFAPTAVTGDGNGNWAIVDRDNHRVLLFNSNPTANYPLASAIIGQTNGTNTGANNGGLSGSTVNTPYGVNIANGRLVVGDGNNNRILVWNSIPTSNGVAADFIYGQANATSNSCNRGGTADYNTICTPGNGIISPNNRLWMGDGGNSRVLGIKY